jgi:hypothetical protein
MKKARKTGSRSGGSPANLQNLIVLLLVLLLVVNFFHLYLDHFGEKQVPQIKKQEMASSATPQQTSSKGSQAPTDSAKTTKGSMVPALSQPAPVPLLTADMPKPSEVQVQVLNGCGTPGVAGKIRGVLRQRGFDVLSFGNAGSQNYDKTQVVARSQLPFSELAARRLAHSLGISADQISVQENLGLGDIDVTLILGTDHQKLKVAAE